MPAPAPPPPKAAIERDEDVLEYVAPRETVYVERVVYRDRPAAPPEPAVYHPVQEPPRCNECPKCPDCIVKIEPPVEKSTPWWKEMLTALGGAVAVVLATMVKKHFGAEEG